MEKKAVDVLNIKELSDYLRIPKSTLYKLVREGKIPSQKVGRHWRFRKKAIDRWLEESPFNNGLAQTGTSKPVYAGNQHADREEVEPEGDI